MNESTMKHNVRNKKIVNKNNNVENAPRNAPKQATAYHAFGSLWNLEGRTDSGFQERINEKDGSVTLRFLNRPFLRTYFNDIENNRNGIKKKVDVINGKTFVSVTFPPHYAKTPREKSINKNRNKPWKNTTATVRSIAQGYENVFDISMNKIYPQIEAKKDDIYLRAIKTLLPGIIQYFAKML